LLITTFRRRVVSELRKQKSTPRLFAKGRLKITPKRLDALLHRPTLRLRLVDMIAENLGVPAAQLLTRGLVVEGVLPPAADVVRDAVNAALDAEGLTLAQVGEALKISKQILSRDLLDGNPSLERLEQISRVVEVEPWTLVIPPDAEVINGQ